MAIRDTDQMTDRPKMLTLNDEEDERPQGRSHLINPTWASALADFLACGAGERAAQTQKYYSGLLGLLSRWAETEGVPLGDFRARHLRLYLAARAASGLSETTRHHDAVVAKVFFKFCRAEGYVAANPLAEYQIRKAARAHVPCPTEEQLKRLLQAIHDRWKPALNPKVAKIDPRTRRFNAARTYAVVAALIDTGARAGEVLALRLEDFQPEAAQLVFPTTKGRTPRVVPISPGCADAITAWLRVRPKSKTGLLFMTLYDAPIPVSLLGDQFRGYVAYAGLPRFTLHGLRHYAATLMAEVNAHDASLILGHKDSRVTRGYLHTSAEHVRGVQTQAAPLARLLVNKKSEQRRKRIL